MIGASKNPAKGGHRIFQNFIVNNFKGIAFPVNPNANGKISGIEFKKSVLDIEEPVDVAIFYIPNKAIPQILEECIQKGVKGAIIEASGFEEVGAHGIELKNEIIRITDNFSKIRVVGPNCMGLTRIDADSDSPDRSGYFTSFMIFTTFKRGNIAVISQSGMLNGGYFTHIAEKYPNIGFRYVCSVGNKMDLSELEFLEYFINDSEVNVIAMYLESFKNPRKFIELCKRVKSIPNKTIILVKGGLTSQGQGASLSHTGSLSENARLTKAIIKQAGIVHAKNFDELFQFARTFSMVYASKKQLPTKGGLAMIFGSGGAGTIASDLTMMQDLKLPYFGEKTYETLVDLFPEWMPPNKFAFVDIWPAMERVWTRGMSPEKLFEKVYDALLQEPEIEGFFHMFFCSTQFRAVNDVAKIVQVFKNSSKPVFLFLIGESEEVRYLSKLVGSHDIPSFSNLEDIAKNFKVLVEESARKQ